VVTKKIEKIENPLVIIGYRPMPIDDLENFIDKPGPPGNMKKQDTIEAWYANDFPAVWNRVRYDSAFCKCTGKLAYVYAVDLANQRIFNEAFDEENITAASGNLAVEFIRWLRAGGHDLSTVILAGFDVKRFARISGVEAKAVGERVPLAYWFQGQNDRTFDPYAMLVEDEQRKVFSLPKLLTWAKIQYPEDWQLHIDPELDARLAAKLIYRLDLLDAASAEQQKFVDSLLPRPKVKEEEPAEPAETTEEAVEEAATT
jgi:hypothetical protein